MLRYPLLLFIPALFIVSCSGVEDTTVRLLPAHWAPLQTHTYRVSVSTNDSTSREYEAKLTILDTLDGATIEWQEFLDSDGSSAYDLPFTRIVYRTTHDGRFKNILNYPELRQQAAELADVYLGSVGVDSAMAAELNATFLDSSNMVSRLSEPIRLVHAAYGAVFPAYEDGMVASWPVQADNDAVPKNLTIRRYGNGLCDEDDGLIPLRADADSGTASGTEVFDGRLRALMHHADSTGLELINAMSEVTWVDDLSVCWWEEKSIPVYIQEARTITIGSRTYTRYIYLFRVEDR